MPAARRPNTRPATEALKLNAAQRAIEDPAKVARAARVVRAAIAAGLLDLADLMPTGSTRHNFTAGAR